MVSFVIMCEKCMTNEGEVLDQIWCMHRVMIGSWLQVPVVVTEEERLRTSGMHSHHSSGSSGYSNRQTEEVCGQKTFTGEGGMWDCCLKQVYVIRTRGVLQQLHAIIWHGEDWEL
jgi:hypothetical protein